MPIHPTDAECAAIEATGRKFVPYRGGGRGVCADCARPVWVGPEQQKLAGRGVPVLCMGCVLKRLGAEGGTIRPLTDKQWGD